MPTPLKHGWLFLLLAGFCATASAQAYKLTTIASDLDFPWGIDFLPSGQLIVTELGGQLRIIETDGTVSTPLAGVPSVYRAGQGGLFDVLLHPDYVNNGLLYLSYAAGNKQSNATTVARARLIGGGLADVEVIFAASPSKAAAVHYGGRMAWLGDGTLLLTTGDGFDLREKAQDLSTHFGKTLRMNADGSPAAGNPFSDAPYVWTYGHRNSQGLTVARDGRVFLHEHGPRGGDEVNLLEPGNNYGWPAITYGLDYNGAYVSPFTEHEGMEQPKHYWTPSIAPSGLMIYEGGLFPEWQNSLFVGALNDNEVRRLSLGGGDGTEVTAEEPLFSQLDVRIRDVREGPQGKIYILTDSNPGAVIRVDPGA